MPFDPHEILPPHHEESIEHIAIDVYDAIVKNHPAATWQVTANALLLAQHWLRLRSQDELPGLTKVM